MAKIEATFVFNPIMDQFIRPALESLYKYTPIEFRVVVVDQTKNGIGEQIKDLADLIIRPRRNLGFAKSMNEGIIHGLHWGSEYVVAANDDILCISKKWWPGILEQFERYQEMMAVCPASVMEPGWGYGLNDDGWVPGNKCPDWGVDVGANIWPKKPDGTAMTKEEAMTEEGYDYLLEHRKGHIEGFAGWFVVGKREMWEKVGLYDERFVPGGAEDYELCHRIYLAGGRASATLGSFIWHEWTKSRHAMANHPEEFLQTGRHSFQDCNALFEHSLDGANSPIFPPRENELFGNKRKRRNSGIFVDDIK